VSLVSHNNCKKGEGGYYWGICPSRGSVEEAKYREGFTMIY